MILHTIQKAEESGLFEEIFVTTEDEEVMQVVEKTSATIIKRKWDLADDHTSTIDVIHDALLRIWHKNIQMTTKVACIYPVTPLLDYDYVRIALEKCTELSPGYVLPALEYESPKERGFSFLENGHILLDFPELTETRTQDLPKRFRDAGQFYVGMGSTWMRKTPILANSSRAIRLRRLEVIDVDYQEDWILAEQLYLIRSNIDRKQE